MCAELNIECGDRKCEYSLVTILSAPALSAASILKRSFGHAIGGNWMRTSRSKDSRFTHVAKPRSAQSFVVAARYPGSSDDGTPLSSSKMTLPAPRIWSSAADHAVVCLRHTVSLSSAHWRNSLGATRTGSADSAPRCFVSTCNASTSRSLEVSTGRLTYQP